MALHMVHMKEGPGASGEKFASRSVQHVKARNDAQKRVRGVGTWTVWPETENLS